MKSTHEHTEGFDIPVLLVVFNRSEVTTQIFDALAQVRPKKLYVAIDAPREGNLGDIENRAIVKSIVTNPSWECEVRLNEPHENLGVDASVHSAISWMFETEERGIIFEDDCLAEPSFFRFCEELLEKYKDDERVMCISGDNFQNGRKRGIGSYYFSIYPHTWGWATWRRAWKKYDTVPDYSAFATSEAFAKLHTDARTRAYWRRILQGIQRKNIVNWDYIWTASCWYYGGLTCIPNVNLVSNIGFGGGASHTVDTDNRLADIPGTEMQFPLRHPLSICVDEEADHYTNYFVFETHRTIKSAIIYILRQLGVLHEVRTCWFFVKNRVSIWKNKNI